MGEIFQISLLQILTSALASALHDVFPLFFFFFFVFFQDGSTVAAILVLDDVVYSANLGDSRAVLCRRISSKESRLSFVHLTKDHNPSNVSMVGVVCVCVVRIVWVEGHGVCGEGVAQVGWAWLVEGWVRHYRCMLCVVV